VAELHFKQHLTKTNLDFLAAKYHLRDAAGMEKYIMNFEILFHVLKVLPDCVVKGGMAVPFHVDNRLKRLSEDIDMVTRRTKEETENAIDSLKKDLEPLIDIRQHIPVKPTKRLPLLTYWCKYKSDISPDSQMKLEIFYGDDGTIRPKTVNEKTDLMGFTIDFPISIYDHTSLIADKVTTLAFQTIGLPKSRRPDAPKQVYDIASLLKSFNGTLPIDQIVVLLADISRKESGYCQNEYSFDEILTDLEAFSNFMIDDALTLNPRDAGHFGEFRTNLLTTNYNKTEYVVDILLITLFIKLTRTVANKTQDSSAVGIRMREALTRLKNIQHSDSADKSWRREIVRNYDVQEKVRASKFPSRQLYLYDCIREAGRMNHTSNNTSESRPDPNH